MKVENEKGLMMKCGNPKQPHIWGLVDKVTGEIMAVRWHRAAARKDKGPNRTIRKFILVEAK